MKLETFEKMCREVGTPPVARIDSEYGKVVIADGLLSDKGKAYLVKRGAFDLGDYPNGLYVTWWFWEDAPPQAPQAVPLFFDKDHDPSLEGRARQDARINACAVKAMDAMEQIRGRCDA